MYILANSILFLLKSNQNSCFTLKKTNMSEFIPHGTNYSKVQACSALN